MHEALLFCFFILFFTLHYLQLSVCRLVSVPLPCHSSPPLRETGSLSSRQPVSSTVPNGQHPPSPMIQVLFPYKFNYHFKCTCFACLMSASFVVLVLQSRTRLLKISILFSRTRNINFMVMYHIVLCKLHITPLFNTSTIHSISPCILILHPPFGQYLTNMTNLLVLKSFVGHPRSRALFIYCLVVRITPATPVHLSQLSYLPIKPKYTVGCPFPSNLQLQLRSFLLYLNPHCSVPRFDYAVCQSSLRTLPQSWTSESHTSFSSRQFSAFSD